MMNFKTIMTGLLFLLLCSCATINRQEKNPFLLYNSKKVIDFLQQHDIKARSIQLAAVKPLVYKVCWIATSNNPKLYYAIDFKGKIVTSTNPFEYYLLGDYFMINSQKFRQITKDGVIYITLP